MSKKNKRIEKEVATKYTNLFAFDTHRKLSLVERLKIAIGFNVEISTRVWTQWKPGKFNPNIVVSVTNKKEPEPVGDDQGVLGTPINAEINP